MRVAIDITVPDRAITGVGVYARRLIEALTDRPLDLQVWNHPLAPPEQHRVRNGARLVAWHQIHVPVRIRRAGIDVYHSACAVGPLHRACPTILTLHDALLLSEHTSYGPLDRLYHRFFSVAAARQSAAVIVPTAHARTQVLRGYRLREHQVHLVPHGVSHRRFHRPPLRTIEATKARFGLSRPYILMVGASSPRKNGVRLVEAFSRVTRCFGADVELVIVGSVYAELERVLTAAPPWLAQRIRRPGIVSEADLPSLYAGARCLAYPSCSEGFGLPILEAMACGTAVVTSRGGATEEVAGDAAALADSTDVSELTSVLERVVARADVRDAMVARGLDHSRAFSWEQTAALTHQVYQSIA